MRKLYLTAIIVVIILSLVAVMAFYYLSMPTTTPNSINEPQNQGNESQGSVINPSRIPYNNQTNEESNESGGGAGGAGAGGSSGSGTSNSKPSTVKYNLSIVSDFSDLNFFVGYYYEGELQNTTSGPPFSLSIDANTTVCVALNSGYQGTYWTVDGSTYSMTPCYGYNNSCIILMDGPHDIRLKQYS